MALVTLSHGSRVEDRDTCRVSSQKNARNFTEAKHIKGMSIANLAAPVSRLRTVVVLMLLGARVVGAQPPPTPEPEQLDKQFTINGRVIDALGRPVRGAVVAIEGRTTGTVRTDGAGRYKI